MTLCVHLLPNGIPLIFAAEGVAHTETFEEAKVPTNITVGSSALYNDSLFIKKASEALTSDALIYRYVSVSVKPLYIAEVLTVRQIGVLREHAHA